MSDDDENILNGEKSNNQDSCQHKEQPIVQRDCIYLVFDKNKLKVIKNRDDSEAQGSGERNQYPNEYREENNDSFVYNEFTGNEFEAEKTEENNKARKFKFAILVTGYNEALQEYIKTINGIVDGLQNFDESVNIALVFIIDGIEFFKQGMEKKKDDRKKKDDKKGNYTCIKTIPINPNYENRSFEEMIPDFCDDEQFKKFEEFLKPLNKNNGTQSHQGSPYKYIIILLHQREK